MELAERAHAVRRFNRFYTRRIGVLNDGLLGSPFSLAEGRVLYELGHRRRPTATELASELDLDAGYLSRMLRGLASRGLVHRETSTADARQSHLSLTAAGRRAFSRLDTRSQHEIGAMLRRLAIGEQRRLVDAMRTIETLLGSRAPDPVPYVLRPPRPGDMGWVAHRHGALYAEEYGYNEQFEALVASIVAAFVEDFDPKRERCWIAEKEGEVVGSVFLVRKSARVAKLRLLLVEPSARGLGIGARLIGECIRFARQAGYRKITLWTQRELSAARRLYKKAEFTLVDCHTHDSFGKKGLVAETWERPV